MVNYTDVAYAGNAGAISGHINEAINFSLHKLHFPRPSGPYTHIFCLELIATDGMYAEFAGAKFCDKF